MAMTQLEVFFDYVCPYCRRAYAYLQELAPRYPQFEIRWHPCEVNPQPDSYGPHSHLCIQGFFFAKEHGADLWAYHERMFRAALQDRVDITNIDILAAYVEDLIDAGAFRAALRQGTYRQAQQAANDYAYEQSGVWVLPAYRLGGKRLDAAQGVGVTEAQLARFLASARDGDE